MPQPDFQPDLEPRGSIHVECVVNGPIETNSYFVCSQQDALVIDPAWKGEALVSSYVEEHPSVQVKGLVCTHGHADHVGGIAGARRTLGTAAPYMISAVDAPMVDRAIDDMRARWSIDTERPGAPDRLLAQGDVIEFGNARLQVMEVPGHTPGGIVLFAACENGNFAFVGDTLFPGSHGRTDLEGGDERAILASLAKIGRLLPPDTLCLVGHGRATTVGDELACNPFMQG